jgi:hypothetical protein
MNELQLIQEFRAAVPAPTDATVSRARELLNAKFAPRAPWWRRRLVVVVAFAVVTAVGAGAALGLGDRIVDLIRGKPAPTTFQTMMEITHSRTGVAWVDKYEIAGEWRGITASPTPIGPAGIYAAPTTNGELCWHAIVVSPQVTELEAVLMGACGPKTWTPSASMPGIQAGLERRRDCGSFLGDRKGTGETYTVLLGRAAPPVDSILVRLRGRSVRVPVHETFFIQNVPPAVSSARLIGLDGEGRPVDNRRSQVKNEGTVEPCPEQMR